MVTVFFQTQSLNELSPSSANCPPGLPFPAAPQALQDLPCPVPALPSSFSPLLPTPLQPHGPLAVLPIHQAATAPRTFAQAAPSAWNSCSFSIYMANTLPSSWDLPQRLPSLRGAQGSLAPERSIVNHTHAHVSDTLAVDYGVLQVTPCAGPSPVLPTFQVRGVFMCSQDVTTSCSLLLKQAHDRGDNRNVNWIPLTECTNCSFLSMAMSPNLVCPSP